MKTILFLSAIFCTLSSCQKKMSVSTDDYQLVTFKYVDSTFKELTLIDTATIVAKGYAEKLPGIVAGYYTFGYKVIDVCEADIDLMGKVFVSDEYVKERTSCFEGGLWLKKIRIFIISIDDKTQAKI